MQELTAHTERVHWKYGSRARRCNATTSVWQSSFFTQRSYNSAAQKETWSAGEAALKTLCRPSSAMQTTKHQTSQIAVFKTVHSHSDTDNCQGQKWDKTDIQKESLLRFSANAYWEQRGWRGKGKKLF